MAATITIIPQFTSAKLDGSDPTLVQPSNWNATRKLAGGVTGDVLLYDSTQTSKLASLTAVAAGAFLRSAGVAALPIWSTTTLPNAATTGDLLQASASNTFVVLNAVATGNALISGGVATISSWGKIGLTTHVSGTLAAANGGTGAASYTVGDLLQASATTTLSALPAVATGNVLLSGGVATIAAWGKVGLTTHVSGILPTANGGTNIAFFTAAGPTTTRVYTFPDAACTILTTNAAVSAAQGGTGIATYAVGDLVYASAATTLSKLPDVGAGAYLRSGGVTTAPLWSTLILPNAATAGDILVATSTNTIGSVVASTIGRVLIAGGAGVVPNYSPNFRVYDAGASYILGEITGEFAEFRFVATGVAPGGGYANLWLVPAQAGEIAYITYGPVTPSAAGNDLHFNSSKIGVGDTVVLDADGNMNLLLGYLSGVEQTAPAAPAANGYRMYADDSGGKTRLMVKFSSGAAQQLAIQP